MEYYAIALLCVVVSTTQATFHLKLTHHNSEGEGSLLHRLRVKRAWSYPDIIISETREGGSFEPRPVLTIESDAATVTTEYVLKPGSPGVDQGIFTVTKEEKSGIVIQQLPVDREVKARYVIIAEAKNNGVNIEDPVEIVFVVTDKNDNQPIFVASSLQQSVFENKTTGYVFGRVQATDADSTYDDFGVVKYAYVNQVEPLNGVNSFLVSETGEISVNTVLNREDVPTVKFVVTASDGAPGSGYTTTETVTVTIQDANDNAPIYDNPPTSISVGELHVVGTEVFSVKATDQDIGVNKAVYFKITGGNTNDHFSIDSTPSSTGASSGSIKLKEDLDFEEGTTDFSLEITAYNKEASNKDASKFQTVITVQVTVTDENEPPEFLGDSYSADVGENLPEPVPNVVTVKAVDRDFGGQTVTFSIKSTEGWFTIDSSSGEITAANPIDREHPSVNQITSQYILIVEATDNYEVPAFSTAEVVINVEDVNDNAPQPVTGWTTTICSQPSVEMRNNVTRITASDADTPANGPKFMFETIGSDNKFTITDNIDDISATVRTQYSTFDISETSQYEVPVKIRDSPAPGQNQMTSTHTLTINICQCDTDDSTDAMSANCRDVIIAPGGINIMVIVAIIAAVLILLKLLCSSCTTEFEFQCNTATPLAAGFPIAIVIAVIAAILILLIIVLAVVAYRRRNKVELEKQALFLDDDDVRENLQAYHDEGGGEEDNDGYDISALQAPPLIAPKRQDEPPLGGAQPQPRSRVPPDTDIGDYINDAKNQADNDPTAPPFDSLLVFDYEGQGSDAGSLSSLNSGTTDASQDYNYLNNWGPRFKKLADMYGGGESD